MLQKYSKFELHIPTYLLGYLLMIISINIGIQSMVNAWELMMAMVEQFGVVMLTGKPKTFCPEPPITLFAFGMSKMV